ncbi:hypothetical protein QRD02_14180 [Aequorivita sp. SDUM287046]|uniref:Lipoprotein n=1 Tax=Aequorivita aurantiaca TaxID=3053356 RepID=A0ABT8DL07_9FLAO|nr:hypothetical protein [Aequorivita aurantiaca]MDN3725529.1 hypothetical protein [Aequorivita aurantiaca]
MIRIFILTFLFLSSCGKTNSDSKTDFNESDFTQAQGIITKIETGFSYSDEFKRTYHYAYGTEADNKLYGIEKNSDLILNVDDPIIVWIKITDRTKTFIAQRGIINKKLLAELKNDDESRAQE